MTIQLIKKVGLFFALAVFAFNAQAERTVTYMHSDALGSVIAASDEDGEVLWRKQYQPFGTQVEGSDKTEDVSYTGKKFNQTTGLNYYGARHYDPFSGRFVSVDPVGALGATAGNTMMFNRYAYANNNPYKYVDPDGRSALAAFGGLIEETYNYTTGNGFDGENILGALADGYNGEGGGFGNALFEDVLSFVPLGSAVKAARLAKNSLGASKGAARLCFVEGTPVHTKDGIKPIEEIKVGDLVASKNDKTGEVEWKPVVELFRNKDKEVLNIGFVGAFGKLETLGVTTEHPFWVNGKGWTDAGDLAIGDEVSTLENGVVKVASIATDAKKHITYNFEVKDFHTYFVGESALWVHNVCFVSPLTERINAGVDIVNQLATVSFRKRRAKSLSIANIEALKGELRQQGVKSVVINSGQIVEPSGKLLKILQTKADNGGLFRGFRVFATGNSKNAFVLTGDL